MNDVKDVLSVHIGEVKVARNGETLKAILGSCVGIGFIWKRKSMCGLAHCFLPENPEKSFSISGRYVDQAIASLFALMKIRPEDVAEIDVIFAGGGNMTNPDAADNSKLIGGQNLSAAERELKKKGMKIVFVEYGGCQGRKVTIDSASCTYQVEAIPRLANKGALK
ncbi:chemotaxis protein CheD [uncultured Bdellovibrio sp.]|uniref:chemotaxis protein CheD n=1 Tax=Bdellovibrio sp. HCB-162 TaxID=3394234 RepID=UPI0025E65B7B|nr:chemotaxis protein CheD [uncultured Bdellovibrio sp.]